MYTFYRILNIKEYVYMLLYVRGFHWDHGFHWDRTQALSGQTLSLILLKMLFTKVSHTL